MGRAQHIKRTKSKQRRIEERKLWKLYSLYELIHSYINSCTCRTMYVQFLMTEEQAELRIDRYILPCNSYFTSSIGKKDLNINFGLFKNRSKF